MAKEKTEVQRRATEHHDDVGHVHIAGTDGVVNEKTAAAAAAAAKADGDDEGKGKAKKK